MKPKTLLSAIDFTDRTLLTELASLSQRAGQSHSPTWPCDADAAMQELQRASESGVLTRVVFDRGSPSGWIAAQPQGHGSWEIHTLNQP